MFYQIKSYKKFLARSTNQHGVHSPFVYNLITKCFYSKKKYNDYKLLKKYRSYLLSSKKTIYYSGLNTNLLDVKKNSFSALEFVKKSSLSIKKTRLLYRLSDYFQFKNSIELGTTMGIVSQSIYLGSPNNKSVIIESCPNISVFIKNTFSHFNIKNTDVLTGDFNQATKALTNNKYDLIYFDGNHKKENLLNYFKALLPTATNDSVFIFNAIYSNKSNTAAWQAIKQHSQVSITIDTFFLGIVFFRQEQAKQHFMIRV